MDEYTRREMLRFLSKIKTLNNGCWEWTSTINRKGYGVLSVHGKPVAAYRVSTCCFAAKYRLQCRLITSAIIERASIPIICV